MNCDIRHKPVFSTRTIIYYGKNSYLLWCRFIRLFWSNVNYCKSSCNSSCSTEEYEIPRSFQIWYKKSEGQKSAFPDSVRHKFTKWPSFKILILSFHFDYIVFVFYFCYIGQPVAKIRRDLTFRGELDDFTNKVV